MLGTKAKPKPKQNFHGSSNIPHATTNESGVTCVVSKGTTIEGKFSSSENIRLDGIMIGEVFSQNRIVLGGSGRIEGTLKTKDAVVEGTIEGEITASGTLHLKSTAFIKGSITAQFLVVDEGAKYFGECHIGK